MEESKAERNLIKICSTKPPIIFGVKPNEILHIGDNLTTDVQGAIQAGCQAVWINLSGKDLNSFTEASVLPTLEINHLTELLTL